MSQPLTVSDGIVVLFTYTLKDGEGVVLDSVQEPPGLPYLHGCGNLVPGLEAALAGASIGDRVQAVVPPEQAYGVRDPDGVQVVPRAAFPGDIPLAVGLELVMTDEDDEEIPVWVTALDAGSVTLDANHPLAGTELHFDVVVRGLREATAEEAAHGHPHGADGTHSHGH